MSGGYLLLADGFGGGAPPAPPSAIGYILATRPPSSYRHTAKWITDVLTSANGAEHRRALAAYPREAYEATYHLDAIEAAEMRGVLYAIGATPVLLPEEHEALPALAAITAYTISIDTTRSDAFAVGVSVLVRNGADQAYGGVISAIAPGTPGLNTITIDALPTAGLAFAAGSDVVPLRQISMADGQPLARYAQGDGILTVGGQATTLRTTIGTGATLTTFDGIPVVTYPAERDEGGSPTGEQTTDDLIVIDYGGAFEVRTDRTSPAIQRGHRWTVDGPTDRQWWKLLAATLYGKQGRALLPTWRADLALSIQPAPGATTLLVTDAVDYAGVWYPDGFRWLQLAHADGSVEYTKASAAVDNGNGTQSVTCSAVSGTAVTMVSMMDPVRLNTDEVVTEWQAGLVGDLALAFSTIPAG
jgi:hypothetical protein